MSGGFDPLVPRPIDLPTEVPLGVDLRTGDAALVLDDAKILAAPDDPDLVPRWREQLRAWREGARVRHGAPARYDDPASAWASSCFTVAQVWLWDELFFDFAEQRFTPERLLADARERFGGFDGVVLWHAYPVIGIDDRNQWDFYDVPGLVEAAAVLRAAGVRVFVDYNPWDVGTRRGGPDVEELAAVIQRLGADGVFLDTLRNADEDFVAALDAARPGIGLEGESKLATARIADHTLSWAQWFADSEPPGVLRAHLFERRHMQHHVRRWHRDHSRELLSAWLNGVGVMVWEVVFGAWVGWSDHDAATLRRMLPVQRGLQRWLTEGEWTPLAVCDPDAGLYGSAFELDDVTLVTLANTSDRDVRYAPDGRWMPLHGDDAEAVLVPAHGVAAVVRLAPDAVPPARVDAVRTALAAVAPATDASFPHRRPRRLRPASWTGPAAASGTVAALTDGAVAVAPGQYVLTVRFRQRETGMYDGAPYVDEWKPLPPRLHDQRTLERVAVVDRPVRVAAREVSEAEYAAFLDATGGHGADPRSAVAFGSRARQIATAEPDGDAPATGVTLAQARAFAAWAGGRLPTEDEWQLAAMRPGFARREPRVWNWTESEHSDGRSRFVMLKGGAAHVSEGSDWYFDGGARPPEFSAKYLLPGLGMDASPSIGFRVCWEVEPWERSTD